ncbi:HAD-IA family hydrolase [Neisseria leonii]|uniref:phosphoglycolate phosphatase n=1 Tax=Neisseria leonii TaxID=2995413 RepID=A0A9X4E386_9NEIS|nr:HAD-IA family hydrolase [Neisseria sp. 51.81]MDD9326867.1 HAD-IA family hydrolase [Neisseria sp. 51.81]
MEIQAVLFDLDGTLADTAPDLGGALNRLLAKKGLPPQSMAAIRPVASHGAAGLIMLGAGIGKDHADYAAWRAEYLAEYGQCFDRDTVLFEGVAEVLAGLAARGIRWGIITNKPAAFTDRLVPHLAFDPPPEVVVSGDTCGEAKPSVKPMLYACAQLGIAPQYCLYVGDAERDMQAGRAAGMRTVLAGWGYIADSDDTDSWPADDYAAVPLALLGLADRINGR